MNQADLFPLRLSDFEYCMYVDDSPEYPMTFCLQAHLQGTVRKLEFESSLAKTLTRHPLFHAFVKTSWRGSFWIPATDASITVTWIDADSKAQPQPGWINLQTETGLRIWIKTQETRSTITFQIHHACCDGIGSLQFIGDLLAHYGQLTASQGQEKPEVRELDPELLRHRGDLIAPERKAVERRNTHRSLINLVHRFRRLTGRRTMVLACRRKTQGETNGTELMQTRVLKKPYCRALRRLARDSGTSVNDLYLREMFLTLRDWNRSEKQLPLEQWLRIAMPVSMRTSEFSEIPACNMVSLMFLPRTPSQCEDAEALLQSIRDQTLKTLTGRLGNLILAGIRHARRIPGLLNWMMSRQTGFATSILANIGEVKKHFQSGFPIRNGQFVAGNLVLERLDGVAPVRPGTRMSVSLGLYSSDLIVNMRCDPVFFSESDTQELLDLFIDRLKNLADPNTRSRYDQLSSGLPGEDSGMIDESINSLSDTP